jgi:hypothetical protein
MTSSSARAAASRRNGARSRGPTSAAGTARAARRRARRADRRAAALLDCQLDLNAHPAGERPAALGLGLIRDGNGPRALATLVRDRGSLLAERCRGLGALRVLQASGRAGRRGRPKARPTRPDLTPPTTKRTRESALGQ